MDTLLAEWYWHYFQQNRWRFMQRTATAAQPGNDFTTWDLPRLFAEIDKQFQKALAAEKTLKATPIGAWDDLLPKGTMPDSYRPTLYDFIAHEALEFYTSGEQAAAKPEDAFELSADSPALDSSDKFLAWWRTFPAKQFPDSPIIKALTLYGALMAFHEKDTDPTPFSTWTWRGWPTPGTPPSAKTKDDRYQAALKAFIWTNGPITSCPPWPSNARPACSSSKATSSPPASSPCAARRPFPNPPAASSAATWSPRSSPSPLSHHHRARLECAVARHHRPLPQPGRRVYFRAIPADWETFLEKRHNRPENLNDQERREVLARKPALEWSAKLPPTADYKEKTFATPAPDSLKPGFYFIAASHDPKFGENDNVVSMTAVWVSDLALVTRTRDGRIEGFVLQAGSGEPVAGAEVSVWHLDNQGDRVADPALTTDENGFFSLKPSQNRGYLFRARHNGQELATANDLWAYDWQHQQPRARQPRPSSSPTAPSTAPARPSNTRASASGWTRPRTTTKCSRASR